MATAPMPLPPSPGKDNFSRMLMIGSSLFGGGSALYLAVQLVREQPDRAFTLMQKWGPGYLLAFFCAFALNKLVGKMVDGTQRTAERSSEAVEKVAEQMQSLAAAAHAQALATQAIADKDDRDKQEMQLLVGMVNDKVAQTLDEQKRQNRALERIENALNINRPEGSDPK